MHEPTDVGRQGPRVVDDEFGVRWLRPEPVFDPRRERFSTAIFTGVNVVVFMILVGCVLAAGLLYNRWH